MEVHHQKRYSINVWAAIVGDELIGPVELPNRVTAEVYCHFLQDTLPNLLKDVPLNVRGMWFMQDGHPAHSARQVTALLNNTFNNRWIGNHGPVHWPARSPDLNPIDFFSLGIHKK